jgi:hypothetical protein
VRNYFIHRGDAEDTEVAQRKRSEMDTAVFCARCRGEVEYYP